MEKSTVRSGSWKRRALAILLAFTLVSQQGGFTFAGEADPAAAAAAEEQARAEAEAKAKAEAEAQAKAEAEAKAKAEAEAKAKAEAEAKAKAEAEAKAKAEAEAKAKAESEAKAKAESEAKAKAESEAKAKAESEAKAKAESEAKAKAESEKAAQAGQNAAKETEDPNAEPSSESASTEKQDTPSETLPQTEAAGEGQSETTDAHDADTEKASESETKESETEEEFKTEFEYSDSSVIVKAVTTEGAGFPKDTQLRVDYLTPGTPAYEAALASVKNALGISDEDGRNLYGVIYDVYFIVKGNRVDPDDTVRITMTFPRPVVTDIPEEEDIVDTVVIHVNDDGSANSVKEYVNAAADGSISQVGFNSDDFSPILVGAVTQEAEDEDTLLTAAAVTSDSLNDFLTNVNIEGLSEDGKAKADTPYSISFSFAENADKQFANTGSLTYTVPYGLSLTPGTHGSFSIKGSDSTGSYEVPDNTYSVDSNGNIVVTWATSDPNWHRVAAGADCQFSINISGTFTQDTEFKNGNGEVIRTVTFDNTSSVTPSKSAVYDPATNKITYTIKAKSDGVNQNVHFKDQLKGNAVTLDAGSFTISSSTGRSLSVPSASGNGFEYTVDSMSHNEEITITYTATVNLAGLDTSNVNGGVINVNVDATGNEVEITTNNQGDGTKASSYVNQIQYSDVRKSGEKGSVDGSGKQTISWSITANENANFAMNGQSIKDTIDAASQDFMKYSGAGITVKKYRKDGALAGTETIPWSNLKNHSDSSWEYSLIDTVPYKYEITYTTEVDTTQLYATTTVSNKVEGGGGSSSTGSVPGIEPGEGRGMGIAKEATEVSYSEVTWTSTITVPKQGLPAGTIFTDYLPTAGGFTDALKANTVSNTVSVSGTNAIYSVDTSDGSKVVISFPHGIPGNGNVQTVTVVLTTTNNSDWLAAAESNGWLKEHTNNVKLEAGSQHVEANATARPVQQKIDKAGIQNSTDYNGRPVFKFDITFAGVTDDSFDDDYLILHDTFDKGIFEYSSTVDWLKTTLYTGDQYYQGTTISNAVTAEETETGVDFKLSKDKMKSPSGEYYSYFRIEYFLIMKADQVATQKEAAAKADGATKTYQNHVTSKVGNKECDFSYTVDTLTKEKLPTTTLDDGNKLVEFRITANKDAVQMNGGNPLQLTDTYTNLSVDYTTIKATDADGNVLQDVSWNYSGYTGTFTIPDSKTVIITYKARVVGTGQVNFSNIATLNGLSKEQSGSEYITTSGTGSVSNHSIRILKHESGATSKGLQGAKFYLYDKNKNLVKDKNGQPVSVETGEDGVAKIEGDMEQKGWALFLGEQYYVKEFEAPAGYELKTTYYGFKLEKSADYDNYIYFDNDVLKISNKKTPCTATIEGVKTMSGREFQNGDEFRFNISISASGATDAEGNVIPNANIPLPKGSDNADATSVSITPSEGNNYYFAFEKITFTEPGTYHYTVKEDAVNKDGVTSDSKEVDVTVEPKSLIMVW